MPHTAFYPGSGKTSIPRVPPSPRHKAIYVATGCSKEVHVDVNKSDPIIDNNQKTKVLDDDDGDDDDDGNYEDDDDDDESDDDSQLQHALEQLVSSPTSSRNLYAQVLHKKRMYSTLLSSAGDRELSAKECGMAPLILGTVQ